MWRAEGTQIGAKRAAGGGVGSPGELFPFALVAEWETCLYIVVGFCKDAPVCRRIECVFGRRFGW